MSCAIEKCLPGSQLDDEPLVPGSLCVVGQQSCHRALPLDLQITGPFGKRACKNVLSGAGSRDLDVCIGARRADGRRAAALHDASQTSHDNDRGEQQPLHLRATAPSCGAPGATTASCLSAPVRSASSRGDEIRYRQWTTHQTGSMRSELLLSSSLERHGHSRTAAPSRCRRQAGRREYHADRPRNGTRSPARGCSMKKSLLVASILALWSLRKAVRPARLTRPQVRATQP